jgi:hypothetical protein
MSQLQLALGEARIVMSARRSDTLMMRRVGGLSRSRVSFDLRPQLNFCFAADIRVVGCLIADAYEYYRFPGQQFLTSGHGALLTIPSTDHARSKFD